MRLRIRDITAHAAAAWIETITLLVAAVSITKITSRLAAVLILIVTACVDDVVAFLVISVITSDSIILSSSKLKHLAVTPFVLESFLTIRVFPLVYSLRYTFSYDYLPPRSFPHVQHHLILRVCIMYTIIIIECIISLRSLVFTKTVSPQIVSYLVISWFCLSISVP